jgi:hypothetical protein
MNIGKDTYFVGQRKTMKNLFVASLLPAVILFHIQNAQALTYSSNLKFKITNKRILPEDFVSYVKVNPALVSTFQKKTKDVLDKKDEQPSNRSFAQKINLTEKAIVPKGFIPSRISSATQIFVVDEEALLNGRIQPIANAQVSLIHPSLNSKKPLLTNQKGILKLPYPLSESVRFFVRSNGFAMGMGYATLGETSVVPLVNEKRISIFAKSLSLRIPRGQISIVGRFLNSQLSAISNAQINFVNSGAEVIYSGSFFGIPGYYFRSFKVTGQDGGFIANGLSRSLHSIEIFHEQETYPGYQIDLTGIPEDVHFVSLALQSGSALNLNSSVVDGDSFDRPDCGLQALVAGQRNVFIPQEDGNLWIESRTRPTISNLKIKSNCKDYLPTYLSQISHETLFPPTIGLFSTRVVNEMIKTLNRSWSKDESLVLGHIYPQKDFKHPEINETFVKIFDAHGHRAKAEVFYFDHENNLDPRIQSTDAHYQNFLVTGLEEGEYHFVYQDAHTKTAHGMQVVRVRSGGITQVDF